MSIFTPWEVVFCLAFSDEMQRLLEDGWEPFGASTGVSGHFVWLRRRET